MDAYQLQTYGPEGLVRTQTDEPTTGPGQVKIKVANIAINPLDWKLRNGFLADALPLPLPVVIGTDMAGTVVEIGDGVSGLTVGDRVAGYADSGAFAEISVTREARITKVPAGVTLETAAALVTSAETAQRVIALAHPEPGSTVLVNGAAGAVGSLIVQLLAGKHRVIGTASEINHDYLRTLGATPISYGDAMLDDIRKAAPEGVGVAIDTAGRDFIERVAPLVPARWIVTTVDFEAAAVGAVVAAGDPTELTAETISTVLRAAGRGDVTVVIDTRYAFDELPAALNRSQAGHLRGKLVVAAPN